VNEKASARSIRSKINPESFDTWKHSGIVPWISKNLKLLKFAKHSTEKSGNSRNKVDFTVPRDLTITPNDEEQRTEKG